MSQDSTPQDKKRLSRERDGRNCYGENDKSSRKAIRRRKAIVNRSFRRATKQTLAEPTDDAQSLQENVQEVKRINWKKVPDKPLGDHLFDRLIRQIVQHISKASEPNVLLDDLERQLIENDVPSQAVEEVMSQLRGIVRAHNSTSFRLRSRSGRHHIDYRLAELICDIFNRKQA